MLKRHRATNRSRETAGACDPPLSARWVVGSTVLSVVEFFGFATGRVERRVASLERSIARGPPGLTVSPDGRWIPYTRIDQSGAGIYGAGKLSAPRRAASLGCGVPAPELMVLRKGFAKVLSMQEILQNRSVDITHPGKFGDGLAGERSDSWLVASRGIGGLGGQDFHLHIVCSDDGQTVKR